MRPERQNKVKKTYSTREAAAKIGVGMRTVSRWLADGKIKPSMAVPMGGGRTLWRWSEADIARARKIDQTPGRKPKK
jgi:excisionase family DNA binding protein